MARVACGLSSEVAGDAQEYGLKVRCGRSRSISLESTELTEQAKFEHTRIGWIVRVKPHNAVLARLSCAQRAALSHVEAVVRRQEAAVRPRLVGILSRAGCATDTYDEAMKCVRLNARVVIHFHPDRFGPKSTTVAEALLLNDGVYRSQFETGLSSGSVSAYPGGLRDTWENTFGTAQMRCAGTSSPF